MKIKLLFIISSMFGAGAEKTLVELLNSLEPERYSITLLLINYKGVNIQFLPKHIKIKSVYRQHTNRYINHLKWRWSMFLLKYPTLIHHFILCEKYDYEIAFTEGDPLNILMSQTKAYKIARLCINIAHDSELRAVDLTSKYLVYNLDFIPPAIRADFLWCICQDQAKIVKSLFPTLANKIRIFSNFRNIANILNLANQIQIRYERKTIISMGQLKNRKRFDILISAFANVVKIHPDWQLKIIGEGNLLSTLTQQVKDLNLSNHVEFMGYQLNPFPYLKAANMFVLASEKEGFANVILEALALSLPVISTDCLTGPRDILNNGEFGRLVPCNDSEALAHEITELISNDLLRENLISGAYKRALEFDKDNLLPKFEHFLQSNILNQNT